MSRWGPELEAPHVPNSGLARSRSVCWADIQVQPTLRSFLHIFLIMKVESITLLLAMACSALTYPHYDKTEWSSGSLSPDTANGWYMTGEVNIQTRFEGNPPDL